MNWGIADRWAAGSSQPDEWEKRRNEGTRGGRHRRVQAAEKSEIPSRFCSLIACSGFYADERQKATKTPLKASKVNHSDFVIFFTGLAARI